MFIKEILSACAIILTFVAFVPYIKSILHGITKPHAFSWVIWAACTFIVFLAQLADKGGVGAWPIGISGLITIYVAILCYSKKLDSSITRGDWLFFILAMLCIPLWYFTSKPLWAVIILTFIDLLGFAPTFRKSFINPFSEQLTFFALMAARNLISIMALENFSLTTVLFPAATAMACLLFITMVIMRRHWIKA